MSGKLKDEDAKKYKIVSRILGVLTRIGNVCCWIGVVAVAFSACATAVIVPNVKIDSESKEISFFDQTTNYDIRGKNVEIGEGKDKIIIKDNTITVGEGESVVSVKLSENAITDVEKFIEKDAMKILAALPYVLVIAMVAFVFIALALGHGARVFKNIATKDTPFIEENVERTEKAAKYLIIGFVTTFAGNLIMTIVAEGKAVNLNGGSITAILALYVVVYIFKCGLAGGTKKAEKEEKKD